MKEIERKRNKSEGEREGGTEGERNGWMDGGREGEKDLAPYGLFDGAFGTFERSPPVLVSSIDV